MQTFERLFDPLEVLEDGRQLLGQVALGGRIARPPLHDARKDLLDHQPHVAVLRVLEPGDEEGADAQ